MHLLRLAPRALALLAALILGAPVGAASIDFEDLGQNLPVDSDGDPELEDYYNGYSADAANQPTDFATTDVLSASVTVVTTFNNEFSNFGGGCCWSGWAYSQTTDSTTPGPGNQHSAIPGSGAGGSETYGVAFTSGAGTQAETSRIVFDRSVSLLGASLTNTTYAALSMRDGDAFAKKFGGASGGDPDYFILTITGRDAGDAITGSVDFALADYRFADDQLDYIVMDWVFVDLSGLGSVAALEFELASSDVGQFGMNTPSYFALDDLVFVPEPGSAALLALGLALLARQRS
jgi:hypothetical protein